LIIKHARKTQRAGQLTPQPTRVLNHWKNSERKRKKLLKLGVEPVQAFSWSRSRMGGWVIAQSPILATTITIDRLVKRGYEALTTWYIKVAPNYKDTPLLGC
jgi:hypothetical protein